MNEYAYKLLQADLKAEIARLESGLLEALNILEKPVEWTGEWTGESFAFYQYVLEHNRLWKDYSEPNQHGWMCDGCRIEWARLQPCERLLSLCGSLRGYR